MLALATNAHEEWAVVRGDINLWELVERSRVSYQTIPELVRACRKIGEIYYMPGKGRGLHSAYLVACGLSQIEIEEILIKERHFRLPPLLAKDEAERMWKLMDAETKKWRSRFSQMYATWSRERREKKGVENLPLLSTSDRPEKGVENLPLFDGEKGKVSRNKRGRFSEIKGVENLPLLSTSESRSSDDSTVSGDQKEASHLNHDLNHNLNGHVHGDGYRFFVTLSDTDAGGFLVEEIYRAWSEITKKAVTNRVKASVAELPDLFSSSAIVEMMRRADRNRRRRASLSRHPIQPIISFNYFLKIFRELASRCERAMQGKSEEERLLAARRAIDEWEPGAGKREEERERGRKGDGENAEACIRRLIDETRRLHFGDVDYTREMLRDDVAYKLQQMGLLDEQLLEKLISEIDL